MKLHSFAAVLLVLSPLSVALVGSNASGEFIVTMEETVSKTGEDWNATLRPVETPNKTVEGVQSSDNGVSWTGRIEAPTPCHSLDFNVTSGDSYRFNVETVEEPGNGVCAQVVTPMGYAASLDGAKKVEILHNGEKVKTVDRRGLLARIMDFLGL